MRSKTQENVAGSLGVEPPTTTLTRRAEFAASTTSVACLPNPRTTPATWATAETWAMTDWWNTLTASPADPPPAPAHDSNAVAPALTHRTASGFRSPVFARWSWLATWPTLTIHAPPWLTIV